ncbi:MAG: hypothetical protein OXF19_06840, partial [Hyphomicrobiales bacterium]|nr:hypothetical protein [Hyphomicrobiales bacterium]
RFSAIQRFNIPCIFNYFRQNSKVFYGYSPKLRQKWVRKLPSSTRRLQACRLQSPGNTQGVFFLSGRPLPGRAATARHEGVVGNDAVLDSLPVCEHRPNRIPLLLRWHLIIEFDK